MKRTAGWTSFFLLQYALVTVLLIALIPAATAQETVGTISGTVADPQGAVVPSASVKVINQGTAFSRTGATNNEGFYTFPQLPLGAYSVEVSREGFKTQIKRNIDLHSASTAVVNVKMEVGAVSETISVDATVETVNTETTSRSDLVEGDQVRELPLNGRNFMQLTQLIPGVSPREDFNSVNKGLLAGVDMSINGGGRTGNVFTVDGANNNDVGSNRTIMVYPSLDSIAEVKVEANSYGAEYQGATGARVNIVTRSGTNALHGSVYYFGRNDKLNANDYLANRSNLAKAPLRRNDFGYSVGGPLKKDKVFFFWSQEWNRDIESPTRTALVPTAAELSGDFRGTAGTCRGATGVWGSNGSAALGTVIPTANKSPAGQLLVQLMPPANIPATAADACPQPNWAGSIPAPQFFREDAIRGDINITKTTTLMLRYAQNSWNITNAGGQFGLWGDPAFSIIDSKWDQPGKVAMARLSKVFGSNIVNDFQFSYSANKITTTRSGTNPGLADQIRNAVPTVFPLSQKSVGDQLGAPFYGWGVQGYPTLWSIAPWNNSQDLYTWRDDLTIVKGTHSLKFGGLVGVNLKDQIAGNGGWGNIFEAPFINGFSASPTTGNAIADLLTLGTTYGISENSTNPQLLGRWRDYEFYGSDSWKVHPRLTLTYGLRWSFLRAPYAADDRITAFNPSAYNPALGNDPCNGLLVVPGNNLCADAGLAGGVTGPNRAFYENSNKLIAPRLGLAWDITGSGKTSLRLGLGQFFHRTELDPFLFNLVANPPLVVNANFTRTLDSATCVSGCGAPSLGSPQQGRDTAPLVPNVWQWHVTVEREIVPNHKFSLAYVANHGVHLAIRQDINQTLPQNRLTYARCDLGIGTCPVASRADLRPFSGAGDHSITYFFNGGSSSYHSFQATVNGRFGRGSLYQFGYTWAKLLSLGSVDGNTNNNQADLMDNANPVQDKGPSFLNRPHTFSGSVVYHLPELKSANRILRGVFGDWEAGTILSFASGSSVTVTTPPGDVTGRVSGLGYSGPDGQHVRPMRVPGVNCHANTDDPLQWFNVDAFTFVGYPLGGNGNSGKGVCSGPGIANADLAFYKNIRAGERVRIQFRWEMFNAFNHTQFKMGNNPNVALTGNLTTNATQVTSFAPNANFGNLSTIGNGAGVRAPRQIQYGLKILF